MVHSLHYSYLRDAALVRRGKVRDIYQIDDDHLLIVTTDRLSAFDAVLPTPIPGKGKVLNVLSGFWFRRLSHIVPNHLTGLPLTSVLNSTHDLEQAEGRAVIVRRCWPLPIEAIVRGYLVGSSWKEYQQSGRVCGIKLPPALREAEKLPEPIFTPSTKAQAGEHDENISFDRAVKMVGWETAVAVRNVSLALYRQAADYASARGILIADTKFEFGVDSDGQLVLIDEALTPDSSRFWPANSWAPGRNPPSFDKQYVRDWLESAGWNRKSPAPDLPPEIAAKTAEKYREAQALLIGKPA